MILYIEINLENLKHLGKNFSWINPNKCPSCNHFKLWGHGYVQRYFNDEPESYWIKRYKCPQCKRIHTCRPLTHYRRFQNSKIIMLGFLFLYFLLGKYPGKHTRQKEQYWIKGFRLQNFLNGKFKDISEGFLNLLKNSIIPFTHSKEYFKITPVNKGTYLSFAVTGKADFG